MAAVLEPTGIPSAFVADRFAALHARFRRPLQRFFASYRLNSHDVDDLTQEVFLRLAGTSCPAELQRPDAFVFTLARNLVRDRARRLHVKAAGVSVGLDEVELRCGGPTPDEALEHDERLARVVAALESLKPASRRAFLLHRVHGYSYAEIARDTGVSVSMIEKHVMAAIAVLREACV
ncbi:MAG: sigma-70 family RNA polymerase sigma factor [Steroidobacteraceae bacterium]|jgi:RNA polymerase sigma-70 factor (ECF subfamily)|nr:sigma-70 family RNA polymerase sigma factor [Steroidobacteraceae bacterium]